MGGAEGYGAVGADSRKGPIDVDRGVGGVDIGNGEEEAAGGGRLGLWVSDGDCACAEGTGCGGVDVAEYGGATGIGARSGDCDTGELGAGRETAIIGQNGVEDCERAVGV